MPNVVGDKEKQFLGIGYYVMQRINNTYSCWACQKGSMILTREVMHDGELKPAEFECDNCHDTVGIAPDRSSQGVMPSLSVDAIKKRTVNWSGVDPAEAGSDYTRYHKPRRKDKKP